MGIFAARDTNIVDNDNIPGHDIAANDKVARVRQNLARHAKPDRLGNIAGRNQVFQNFTGSRGTINIHRLIPVHHHVETEAGKETANVVKMMMGDEQFTHFLEIKTCARELLERALSAIHQNRPPIVGNCVCRRHAMWLGRWPPSGSQGDEFGVGHWSIPTVESRGFSRTLGPIHPTLDWRIQATNQVSDSSAPRCSRPLGCSFC